MEDPRWPGYRHNIHSFFHRALDQMPWYRELELERRGAEYLEPELNVALLLKSGDALCWWSEFERTAESFAQFSARDAATLRAYLAHMSLRLSSWSAVHHDEATTARWLAHSQMWLNRA